MRWRWWLARRPWPQSQALGHWQPKKRRSGSGLNKAESEIIGLWLKLKPASVHLSYHHQFAHPDMFCKWMSNRTHNPHLESTKEANANNPPKLKSNSTKIPKPQPRNFLFHFVEPPTMHLHLGRSGRRCLPQEDVDWLNHLREVINVAGKHIEEQCEKLDEWVTFELWEDPTP